jgi:hypothetical protein
MKFSKVVLTLVFASLVGLLFGGCTSAPEDSSIPWNRPASWEGGIPGMGSPDEDGATH